MTTVLDTRSSGILLHITSLPGKYFSGDLGPEAYDFVKELKSLKQTWWQTLPINPIGLGNSPYSSISSFAGEPILISLEILQKEKLLAPNDLKITVSNNSKRTNYKQSIKFRNKCLTTAFANAKAKQNYFKSKDFLDFCKKQKFWLEDFALFAAIADTYKTLDWTMWPDELRDRIPGALKIANEQFEEKVLYNKFVQYHFDKQWQLLQSFAKKNGIKLMGDIPIFISFKSADVWANQSSFLLNKATRAPTFVAGCPPDRFNQDGQLWGNALYNWKAMKSDDFKWWKQRFKRILGQFDAIRLDHFIGFYRFWAIPQGATTAKSGKWRMAMGDEFFTSISKSFKNMPFLAEDLGAVTPAIRALRDKFTFPGMKVIQFGYGNDGESLVHRPCNITKTSVVYTGTHDNDNAIGWYKDLKKQKTLTFKNAEADLGSSSKDINWRLISMAMHSQAHIAIAPMQDILGLDSKDRMNVPGIPEGNWGWRMEPKSIHKETSERLSRLTELTSRG